jgi:two-component system NtrC family sensor kinase
MLNACDAMPNGGTLNLATRLQSSIDDGTPHVDIRIADTGIGIAPEHLPHLFEPFYTTKPHGTGLGLAISAHIITQHDGQIQVASTIGEGATFVITLPIIE